jgi:hypothetical protein
MTVILCCVWLGMVAINVIMEATSSDPVVPERTRDRSSRLGCLVGAAVAIVTIVLLLA